MAKQQELIEGKWIRAGKTVGGWENVPRNSKEFLLSHPSWDCHVVAAYDSSLGAVIFIDPDLCNIVDNTPDHIVDFTDMWLYIYPDPPEEFYENGAD